MRLAELAEQHGHKLSPTGETAHVPLGLLRAYRPLELDAREPLKQLREDATKSLHGWASLGGSGSLSLEAPTTYQSLNPLRSD
jgi:hypothetical protein